MSSSPFGFARVRISAVRISEGSLLVLYIYMQLFCSHNDLILNQFLSHCRHPLQVERSAYRIGGWALIRTYSNIVSVDQLPLVGYHLWAGGIALE